ncbi:cytochrome c [Devosia sp.]|uniref:c-type cytochrome n=1 Tax=Devosia sp. TaxID=1871048 RepID=UPI0035AF9AC4
MFLARVAAVALALVALAVPTSRAQQLPDLVGDPERGRVVFLTLGGCVSCHGWPGDGKTGLDMRSPTGANLRESELDKTLLTEVISCGRPATQMPYHDRAAYRDARCYGLLAADFAPDTAPNRGKLLREQDIANVVAFLQAKVVGRAGPPTFEECIDIFANPAAAACKNLK